MYILDTDHISVLERGGDSAQPLFQRLATLDPTLVVTTIISYEEQMRGWLSYAAKVKTMEQHVLSKGWFNGFKNCSDRP